VSRIPKARESEGVGKIGKERFGKPGAAERVGGGLRDAGQDVRNDATVVGEALEFLQEEGARTVAIADRIIGCPHEEGIDYPEGESCPLCPFWQGRDRWSGERKH
jgi:hypothetical protein